MQSKESLGKENGLLPPIMSKTITTTSNNNVKKHHPKGDVMYIVKESSTMISFWRMK